MTVYINQLRSPGSNGGGGVSVDSVHPVGCIDYFNIKSPHFAGLSFILLFSSLTAIQRGIVQ